jgi:hypothetical protein
MQRRWLYVIMSGFEVVIWFVSDYMFCCKHLDQVDGTHSFCKDKTKQYQLARDAKLKGY